MNTNYFVVAAVSLLVAACSVEDTTRRQQMEVPPVSSGSNPSVAADAHAPAERDSVVNAADPDTNEANPAGWLAGDLPDCYTDEDCPPPSLSCECEDAWNVLCRGTVGRCTSGVCDEPFEERTHCGLLGCANGACNADLTGEIRWLPGSAVQATFDVSGVVSQEHIPFTMPEGRGFYMLGVECRPQPNHVGHAYTSSSQYNLPLGSTDYVYRLMSRADMYNSYNRDVSYQRQCRLHFEIHPDVNGETCLNNVYEPPSCPVWDARQAVSTSSSTETYNFYGTFQVSFAGHSLPVRLDWYSFSEEYELYYAEWVFDVP